MVKITIKKKTLKKLVLPLIGIILAILFLEIVLHVAGFWIYTAQRAGYEIDDSAGNEYRILALGESTTADLQNGQGSWPEELEITLNKRSKKTKFKVFNEGIPSTTTSVILSKLEDNLNKYKPHMVIAMMGINDYDIAVRYDDISNITEIKTDNFFRNLRVYKLGKFLWSSWKNKLSNGVLPSAQAAEMKQYTINKKNKIEELNLKPELVYYQLALKQSELKNLLGSIELLKKAIEINSTNTKFYALLLENYVTLGMFNQAIDAAEQYQKLKPKDAAPYIFIADDLVKSRNHSLAEEVLKRAIEVDPESADAFALLGRMYLRQEQHSKGEEMLKNALAIDPNHLLALHDLGGHYGELSENLTVYKPEKAIPLLKRLIKLHPTSTWEYETLVASYFAVNKSEEAERFLYEYINQSAAISGGYYTLALYYGIRDEYDKLEEMLKKLLNINPNYLFDLYNKIGKLYERLDKPKNAEELFEMAKDIRNEYFNPITQENYIKLYRILSERKIRLVAMQYPTLSVDGLKIILGENENIIFISNEENFNKALESSSYEELFVDRNCCASFGHATRKGNRLIAENVANVILKELDEYN